MTLQYPLLIPAAGIGSRLFPTSWAVPKELFPVGPLPALHYLLQEAQATCIRDVICITSPRKEALMSYLSYDEDNPEVPLTPDEAARLAPLGKLNKYFNYNFQVQSIAHGVGNAMLQGLEQIQSEYFFMAYPDDLLANIEAGLPALLQAHVAYGGLVIAIERIPRAQAHLYGVVKIKKSFSENVFAIEHIVEKPNTGCAPSEYGIVGRYILSREVLLHLKDQKTEKPCFISALNDLIARGQRVLAVVLQSTRYDIGTTAGWIKAVSELGRGACNLVSAAPTNIKKHAELS